MIFTSPDRPHPDKPELKIEDLWSALTQLSSPKTGGSILYPRHRQISNATITSKLITNNQ